MDVRGRIDTAASGGPPASSVLAGVGPASVGVSDPIEVKEHLADLRRAEVGALGVLGLWPLFGLFDLLQTSVVGTGDLMRLLLFRAIPLPFLLATFVVVRRRPAMTRRAYELFAALTLWSFSVSLSLMCIETGGLTSLYAVGVLLATMGIFFFPTPFRTSLRAVFLTLMTYTAVLYGSTAFVPSMRAQLGDARALGVSVQFHLVGYAIGALVAFVNHSLWSMRRELMRTRSIGKYRLKRLLAKGGMGEVWAAHHAGLRRDVALKILRPNGEESDLVSTRRFEIEVQATAELTHPNTIRVFDYGATEDGFLYYAMELLDGEHLGRLVLREGALEPERAVHFLRQAARALAEAHARGIVHRDVKPENLFVTTVGGEPDFLKVLDFGIAKVLGAETAQGLTGTGLLAGTPATMSPEVILGNEATPASDVYALGTVAYFMLTGTFPFGATVPSATLVAHVNTAPRPVAERRGSPVSAELEALVLRTLEKSPAERWPDGRAFAEALDALPEAGKYRAAATSAAERTGSDRRLAERGSSAAARDEAIAPTRLTRRS